MLRIYVMDVDIVEQAPQMGFQRKAAMKKSVVSDVQHRVSVEIDRGSHNVCVVFLLTLVSWIIRCCKIFLCIIDILGGGGMRVGNDYQVKVPAFDPGTKRYGPEQGLTLIPSCFT